MKSYISLSYPIIICTLFIFFSSPHPLQGKIFTVNGSSLEDAIIINDITMDSISSVESGKAGNGGRIIIDNSFDDGLSSARRRKRRDNKRLRVPRADISVLKELRTRDRRWHMTHYRIKKHDSLWKIARKYDIDYKIIIRINQITSPDMLRPGRKLLVPSKNGVYHRVRRGDTLLRLSRRYKSSVRNIETNNGLHSKIIRIGQRLFIPDVSAPKRVAVNTPVRKKTRKKQVRVVKRSRFHWPLRGKITSGFGMRRDPFNGKRAFHCGIDISANVGTPIHASLGGRVIFSGWKGGYGRVVILRHSGGYVSVYAHNSRNLVRVNSRVKRGTLIAYSGMTGAVTGAHLHFEIRKGVGYPLNPLRFLR